MAFIQRLQPKKASGGGGYYSSSIASSQLGILKNMLEQDGFLSQADYDILIKKAIEFRSYFTSGSKSDMNALSEIDEKISSYMSEKTLIEVKRSQDSNGIRTSLDDSLKNISQQFGADPEQYFSKASEALKSTIEFLGEHIQVAKDSGNEIVVGDLSSYYHEVKEKLNDIDSMSAAYGAGTEGVKTFGVKIDTDSAGRVTKIDYMPLNKIEGMATNAVVGKGIPVFTTPMSSPDGKRVAYLGGLRFDNSVEIPDAFGDGTNRNMLLNGGELGKTITIKPESLMLRDYIPIGTWAKGTKGSLYKRNDDGTYTKYSNLKPDQLGVSSQDIQDVDSVWEGQINDQTVASGGLETLPKEIKYQSPSPPMFGTSKSMFSDLPEPPASKLAIPKAEFKKPVAEPRLNLWQNAKDIFAGEKNIKQLLEKT